jgi:hypothetical protein
MFSLADRAAVSAALDHANLDLDLRSLISRRAAYVERTWPPTKGTRFVIVEGGDTPEVINQAVGFLITGDDAEEPSFDWIQDHGLWFEIAYLRKGRPRLFIYVENSPATELGMHYMCLAHFRPDDDEGIGR